MAEETTAAQAEPQGETTTEPQGTEVDWEAKYNEAVKQSRKWEDRAKANKDKAAKWDAYEQEGMSEAEKLAKRAEQAESELAALRAERQRAEDARAVSEESGVPMNLLLHCGDREDMDAFVREYEAATHIPSAASAPEARVIRGGGKKLSTRDKFASYFDK